MPPADPQQQSLYLEHDDLAAILFYAVQLEHACAKYRDDALHGGTTNVPFNTNDAASFDKLIDALDQLQHPLGVAQHWVDARIGAIPQKNSGY